MLFSVHDQISSLYKDMVCDPNTFGSKAKSKFGKECNAKILNPQCPPITSILGTGIVSERCYPDCTMLGLTIEGAKISGSTY